MTDKTNAGLEGIMKQKEQTVVIKTYDPTAVLQQVKEKKRFIPVDDNFPADVVPDDYVLTHSVFRGKKFSVLMPRQAFWYMANPGEGGDVDSALDEISGLYEDVKEFEKELMVNGKTIPQEVDWATVAREGYSTYLINKLTNDGENFDVKALDEICANDDYVSKRCEAIAALVLGKDAKEIERAKLSDILMHKTKIEWQEPGVEEAEEKMQIKCYTGSHYEYRTVYKKVKRRVLKTESETQSSIGGQVNTLEKEILDYVNNKGKEGEHTKELLRQYINLAYIAKENPSAQLDINPDGNGNGKQNKEKQEAKESKEGGKEK